MLSLDLEVIAAARRWCREGRRIWLVTVAQTFGASPRPPGSLLVMRDDGVVIGSVSGGCIEDDLVARRDTFVGSQPIVEAWGVTADEARRFGLPCGGQLELVIEATISLPALDELATRIEAGEVFAREVDLVSGAWRFVAVDATTISTRDATHLHCVHGPRWRMLIVGASEIARYLAEMAAVLDFRVWVCDPREEVRSAWRVDGATLLEGMPDEVVTAFKVDARTVVVAVAHDPKIDDMALMEALRTDAWYVGAVGSRLTSAARRERLLTLDLTSAQVARLRGPVGLAIGSRTPAEIALAILAELIALRNQITLVAAA